MNEKYEHIKVELRKQEDKEGNYAIISLNRPDKLNAITLQTLKELTDALDKIELDLEVRCIVLRGTKDFTKKPAFSTGQDLNAVFLPGLKPDIPWHMPQFIRKYHHYFNLIEEFPKPIIAAIDGYALGGGTELACVCDIIIASRRSTFGLTEVSRGIFPAGGGTQRLIRYIGLARVTRMLYFGERFSAKKMHNWGLVTFLADDEKFEDILHQKATELGKAATTSLIVMKRCVRMGTQVPLSVGLQFEQLGMGINYQAKDVMEGVKAFMKKKEPNFKGF